MTTPLRDRFLERICGFWWAILLVAAANTLLLVLSLFSMLYISFDTVSGTVLALNFAIIAMIYLVTVPVFYTCRMRSS
jgi:CHASE2 domain-containing sensor protein